MGLVLLISLGTLFLATFVTPLQRARRLRGTILTISVIHLLHSAIFFRYYASIIGMGAIAIVSRVALLTVGRPVLPEQARQAVVTPGPTGVDVGLGALLGVIDHLLIGVVAVIVTLIAAAVVVSHWRSNSVVQDIDPNLRGLLVLAAMMAGLGGTAVAFFVYKGLGGLIFRLTQYLTIYAFLGLVLLFVLTPRFPSRDAGAESLFRRRELTYLPVVLALALVVVSPISFLMGTAVSGSSNHLSPAEAVGTRTLDSTIPSDSRVAGTYHIAPPLAESHDYVVGFGYQRFSDRELQIILDGLYYNPGPKQTANALALLDDEYRHVDVIILSKRASGSVGVVSRARTHPPAQPGYIRQYNSILSANRIYSNGVVVAFRRSE